jgi:hypothetical protein
MMLADLQVRLYTSLSLGGRRGLMSATTDWVKKRRFDVLPLKVTDRHSVTCRLPADILALLDDVAGNLNMSRTACAEEILKSGIADAKAECERMPKFPWDLEEEVKNGPKHTTR